MMRDAKGIGRVDDEAQVPVAEQVSGADVADVGSTARKTASDADWLSMATRDPALYIKDPE